MSKKIFSLLSLGLFTCCSQACLADTRGMWISNTTDGPLTVTGITENGTKDIPIEKNAQHVPTDYFQVGSEITVFSPNIPPKTASDTSNKSTEIQITPDNTKPLTIECSAPSPNGYQVLTCKDKS